MKKINLKKIAFGFCTVALLAISCDNNNQKSVTDGNNNIENLSDNEYDVKATTKDKVLEIEQDAIDWHQPVSDRMTYRLLMNDMDLQGRAMNTKSADQKKKKDWSGLDDKNDLPVAKVVRDEPENDYWKSYEERSRKYTEMLRKTKDIPTKMETDVNKVKSDDKNELDVDLVKTDIIITDVNRSRPPLFSKTCMDERNPEACSNEAVASWIKENINYPQDEIDQEHDGYEYMSFTIGTDGEIVGDIDVVSRTDECPECQEAAVEVLKRMPKWAPALQNGRPVSVEVNLPIRFRFL